MNISELTSVFFAQMNGNEGEFDAEMLKIKL